MHQFFSAQLSLWFKSHIHISITSCIFIYRYRNSTSLSINWLEGGKNEILECIESHVSQSNIYVGGKKKTKKWISFSASTKYETLCQDKVGGKACLAPAFLNIWRVKAWCQYCEQVHICKWDPENSGWYFWSRDIKNERGQAKRNEAGNGREGQEPTTTGWEPEAAGSTDYKINSTEDGQHGGRAETEVKSSWESRNNK